MANLGIHVLEQATAVSIPVVADSGLPYVTGVAPIHMATKPGKVNTPILCTSWDEAVAKLGFSYDWKKYPICEFIYSNFQLFGCQPVIFCNVMDPDKMKADVEAKEYTVEDHMVRLPLAAMSDTVKVTMKTANSANEGSEGGDTSAGSGTSGEATLEVDEDYSVYYDYKTDSCVVELLETGASYEVEAISISYTEVKPEKVALVDIVEGVTHVDDCMTAVGKIPDTLCTPAWSHNTVVAAIMATKSAGIMGLFHGKCLIDADCSETGVRDYSELAGYKNKNNFVDENQIVCWPQVKLGDYQFHLSTQLAGLMAKVDTLNAGCPYESPSNKALKMDTCCLEDGTEVNLNWPQVNIVAGDYGVVTAVNFLVGGWVAKGNYTACYPGNTDVKDIFIPVSRMFDWVGNTLIRTFWSKLDKPMNRRLIDSILDTCNIWLAGLVGTERLLGARAEMLESENNLLDLMAGIIRIHIYITPPSPMQQCDFTLEYDTSSVESALAA